MKKTLSEKINPIITEFKNANGRGSLMLAATHMANMIEILVKHIEDCEKPLVYCANPYPDFETTDYYKELQKLQKMKEQTISPSENNIPVDEQTQPTLVDQNEILENISTPDSEETDDVSEATETVQDNVIEESVSELPKEEEASVEASVEVLDSNLIVDDVQEDNSKKRGRKPSK